MPLNDPVLENRTFNMRAISCCFFALVTSLSILMVWWILLRAGKSPGEADLVRDDFPALFVEDGRDSTDDGFVYAFDFEIFGKVQGVSFRISTVKHAHKLGGVTGYVKNTAAGTVVGTVETASEAIGSEMRLWLEHVGPPRAEVDRAAFTNHRKSEQRKFKMFSVMYDNE